MKRHGMWEEKPTTPTTVDRLFLQAREDAKANIKVEDSKAANEDAKAVIVQGKPSKKSPEEHQEATLKPKKEAKLAKERKGERKRYLVAEWRDGVNEVLLKAHKRKEAKRDQQN